MNEQAEAWMRAEHANLMAAAGHSADWIRPTHAVALSAAMRSRLRTHGPWAPAGHLYDAAIDAARTLGDHLGEANALGNLGEMRQLTGDLGQARAGHGQALNLAREIASPQDEAEALECLGEVDLREGRRAAGARNLRQALEIYRRLGVAGAHRAAARLAELGEG